MADIVLKRGQTADVAFTLVAADGSPFDLTDFVVTLAVNGRGARLQRVGTVAAPTTGAGFFRFTAADYAALKVDVDIPFEVWAVSASERVPFRSGTLRVVDVPQVTA